MLRKFLLPLVALAGVVFAIFVIVQGSKTKPLSAPEQEPPPTPYSSFVAGSGLVEASSRNIAIGTPVEGIVSHIYAFVDTDVKAGDPLILIDDRVQRADLAIRQAAVQVAQAQVSGAQYEYDVDTSLSTEAVGSVNESTKERYALRVAEAQLAQAEAELAASKTALDRLTVRAPLDGKVLQLNVRIGEYAMTGPLQEPLLLFGATSPLHIRTNVDENDAWRLYAGAAAIGYLRGNRAISTPLKFVRFEPYVIPKKSLTGDSSERVDTRVLQVIYSFERGDLPIFVGQQMDVLIESNDQELYLPDGPSETTE